MLWGRDIKAAVADESVPNGWVVKTLGELQPFHWHKQFERLPLDTPEQLSRFSRAASLRKGMMTASRSGRPETLISTAQAVAVLGSATGVKLIAIDGFPCSGKSTLANHMMKAADVQCIYLDDFALPESEWPLPLRPAYPFPFIRHDEFLGCVNDLAEKGFCSYRPFDWTTLQISAETRTVDLRNPVIVEGVSALDSKIAGLYDLRFFVESDESSILATAAARGDGLWARQWQEYFLPSTNLYMNSGPRARADYLVAGRGIR